MLPAPPDVVEREGLAPHDLHATPQTRALTPRDVGKGARGLREAVRERADPQTSPLSRPKWVGQVSKCDLGHDRKEYPL